MDDFQDQIEEMAAAKAAEVDIARTAGDWNRVLAFADSENRAAALVEACRAADDEAARTMLAEWFNSCDALAPWADDLREQFDRVGYVTDDPAQTLDLPCWVYRAAWEDDDPARALSWTTSREVADRFARYLTGPRAWYLGMRRDDVEPWIWRARCHEARAYIVGRDEHEVIPKTLTGIEPIARLTVEGAS